MWTDLTARSNAARLFPEKKCTVTCEKNNLELSALGLVHGHHLMQNERHAMGQVLRIFLAHVYVEYSYGNLPIPRAMR